MKQSITPMALIIALLLVAALAIAGAVRAQTSGTIIQFQAKIASTGTAVALPANRLTSGLICMAVTSNAAPITIGTASVTNTTNGTGNGAIIQPGAGWSAAVNNSNLIYINGTTGDIVSCWGN